MRTIAQIIVFLLLVNFGKGQDLNRYNPIKAEIRGGGEALEQVLQTQLTLPKNFFQSGLDETITIYFLLDSAGRPGKGIFQPAIQAAAQKEFQRMLKFLSFQRFDNDPQLPYSLTIPLSANRYAAYRKQKQKAFLKTSLPADSSFVIYTKADRSPEYYKDGEEGLKEFLLSEMEFPKLAIEKSVSGTVIVEFIIETNGYVTALQVKQPLGAGCSEESLRLIKETRWKPAEVNGKLVRYRMTYPITFSLRSTTKNSGFDN